MTDYKWSDPGSFGKLYEELFVPSLFLDWGRKTVEAAQIQAGDKVLDAACGTGAAARFAREKTEHVVGFDVSEAMLEAAREVSPSIDWRQGDVSDMPFDDNEFDVAMCQFALMFFPDKAGALRELARVSQRIVVAVWQELDQSPGYREFVALIKDIAGVEPASVLASPFSLGDIDATSALFTEAGLVPTVQTDATTATFPSIRAWITTDVRATPLTEHFDDDALEELIVAGEMALAEYADEGGAVSFPAPAHIFTAM